MPAARFGERPAAEEWSANEVMAHVVEAGRHFGGAIAAPARRASRRARPRDALERVTPRRARSRRGGRSLERDRAALFAAGAERRSARRGLEATVEHPFFGPLNWRETLLFIRLHDLDHAGQLQKIAGRAGRARSA